MDAAKASGVLSVQTCRTLAAVPGTQTIPLVQFVIAARAVYRGSAMAKGKTEKRAIKAIDKAVKNAMKSGVSGGLADQTVASAIHAATVKANRQGSCPNCRSW